VTLNGKPDYDGTSSNRTSRRSASCHFSRPLRQEVASPTFNSGDLKALHLNCAALSFAFHSKETENVASPTGKSAEKHRIKKEKNNHHNTGNKYNVGHHKHNGRQYARNMSPRPSAIPAVIGANNLNATYTPPSSWSQNADKKRILRSQTQPVLLPKGQTGQNTRHAKGRTKLLRLHGADLYVTRLGWNTHSAPNESNVCCASATDNADVVTPPYPPIGSLHEEWINSQAECSFVSVTKAVPDQKLPSVLASRPCY
jgi:hypothetical protein